MRLFDISFMSSKNGRICMSMKNYTREDILNLVEEEDVGFIRLQFTDIFGTMKNVAITVSQLKRALITNVCLMDLR